MSQLEAARQACEEIEAMELCLVEELESVPRKSHRSKLAQELRIRNLLQGARERAKRVKTLEIKQQGGLQEFYRRKQLLEMSLNTGGLAALDDDPAQVARIVSWGGRELPVETDEEERELFRPKNRLERRAARGRIDDFVLSHEAFTGEEHLGRYLDLHEHHMVYQNLHSTLRHVSYLDYVRQKILDLPPPNVAKDSTFYANYLVNLKEYLDGFEQRATPLAAIEVKSKAEAASEASSSTSTTGVPFEAELKRATSAQELEQLLDLAKLKQALEARGLKVSGTATQRATRLFAVKNLTKDQYPAELMPASTSIAKPVATVAANEQALRELLQRLRPSLHSTATMITKKLTMTYEEIEKELRDEEKDAEAVERSDDEDAVGEGDDDENLKQTGVIDPSTGRLIPKWMYRLHGLNQEFKCEICGNQSYFGRRAYERHFKDYRHANGMRALGIPNTLHFHDITKIEDAKRLYETLRKELESQEFDRSHEEEYEDSQGNVLTKSVYEDLKREGML